MSDLTPTISRVLSDGTLIELVFDAPEETTALAAAVPGETPRIQPTFTAPSGERLAPYSAQNNLVASGCVLLPSGIGDFGDKRDLVEAVRTFLHRYVDLSPTFEEIAAHYVLLSWVYDAFSDLPYLRLRGDYGTGKTRALLTIGSLCYKPFFASGASTVSPIFHIQDAFQGTLVLDEADFRFSDATSELTKVLNNGTTRGMPVLRTMTNRNRELNPTAFRVFGPKIVAMRERFSDQALESRFLTEDTSGRVLRADIPVHLPASFADEARELRNRLLAWRFHARSSVEIDPTRLAADLPPRAKQSALALLSLIDDPELRDRVTRRLQGDDQRVRQERSETDEGRMLAAVLEAFAAGGTPSVRQVTDHFNKTLEEFDLPITGKRAGWLIRTRLGLATTKSNGVYVLPASQFAKAKALAARFGVELSASPVSSITAGDKRAR